MTRKFTLSFSDKEAYLLYFLKMQDKSSNFLKDCIRNYIKSEQIDVDKLKVDCIEYFIKVDEESKKNKKTKVKKEAPSTQTQEQSFSYVNIQNESIDDEKETVDEENLKLLKGLTF